MSFFLQAEVWLGAADVAVFAAAGFGYLLLRGLKPPAAPDVPSAFGVLEASVWKYAPGIPVGYTWREAFDWLKERGVSADWAKMKYRLADYEAYRYGGKPLPTEGKEDVLKLSVKVRRNLIGKGTKGQGARTG